MSLRSLDCAYKNFEEENAYGDYSAVAIQYTKIN